MCALAISYKGSITGTSCHPHVYCSRSFEERFHWLATGCPTGLSNSSFSSRVAATPSNRLLCTTLMIGLPLELDSLNTPQAVHPVPGVPTGPAQGHLHPPTPSRASTSNSGRSSRIGVTSRPTTPWSNCCGWPSATSRTSAPAPAKPNAANPPTSAPPPPGSSKEPSPPAGDKPSLPIGDLRVARRHAWTRTHHHGARSANDRGGGVVR